MLSQKRVAAVLLLLAGFLTASLLVNFLHSERTIGGRTSCPACQFQSSSLATSQIAFFHLPGLLPLGWADIPESAQPQDIVPPLGISRAPPLV